MSTTITLQCKHVSKIPGVHIKPLTWHGDNRGFTSELFRHDEAPHHNQEMGYISYTLPGISRGPHAHNQQSDYFVFLGPGIVRLTLWDNRLSYRRLDSDRQQSKEEIEAEILATKETYDLIDYIVIIPPGVVHGYKNLSSKEEARILNFPNRLYKGWGKQDTVDEIRYENKEDSIFKLD